MIIRIPAGQNLSSAACATRENFARLQLSEPDAHGDYTDFLLRDETLSAFSTRSFTRKADMNYILKAMLAVSLAVAGVTSAAAQSAPARGEYLAAIMDCAGCHTPAWRSVRETRQRAAPRRIRSRFPDSGVGNFPPAEFDASSRNRTGQVERRGHYQGRSSRRPA
ncbi:MAG: hypothetical protein K0S56_4803 [Microvirga sp.]|nr:hypothetical protein [Microvirga sp.]